MCNEESIFGSAFFYMNFLPLQKLISSEDQPTALKSRDAAVLVDSQESDTRHLYATLLKIWGVPVKESTSVEESISAAAEKTPAAVLLDCVFPFEENLKRIRNLRQSGVFDYFAFRFRAAAIQKTGFSRRRGRLSYQTD
jgi:hypothetical protein